MFVNPKKIFFVSFLIILANLNATKSDLIQEKENKLTPLRFLAQKEAGNSVFNYFRSVLDQVQETYNSALSSARQNPAIQRLEGRIKGMKQSLGLPQHNLLIKP
nr:uncharacterized protein LOC111418205 [Onthophagus taurus]